MYDAPALDALLDAAHHAVSGTSADLRAGDPRQLLGPLMDRTAFLVEPTDRREVARDWLSELDIDSLQQLLPLLKPNPFWAESDDAGSTS